MNTETATPANDIRPAVGMAADTPGGSRLAYVVKVEEDNGPATFTIGASLERNRLRITLAHAGGYVSEPLSEHIAGPMLARARHCPAISEAEAAELLESATRLQADNRAKARADMQERQRLADEGRAEFERLKPEWAKGALVAELVEDDSDSMTDYYNSRTVRTVVLCWARHTRDLFPEMRKAAALFEETADLATAPDSAEHRQKYSMGGGFFLKDGYRHSTGWRVSKDSYGSCTSRPLEFTDAARAGLDAAGAAKHTAEASAPAGDAAAVGKFTISEHTHTKKGFQMWICELGDRVPRPVFELLRDEARDLGGWYSRPWAGTPGGFAFKKEERAHEFAAKASEGLPDSDGPSTPPPSSGKAKPAAPKAGQGDKLRKLAEGLESKIADAFRDRLSNTPKRARQAAEARNEGVQLERGRAALLALAAAHDAGTVPAVLASVTSKKEILELAREQIDHRGGYYDAGTLTGKPRDHLDAGKNAKAAALWELLADDADSERAADLALAQKIEALQFARIPGYFPTPAEIVARMIEAARLDDGARVLEPSAGSGAIADAVREAGHSVECIERHSSLCEIIEAKGHALSRGDFLEYDPPAGELFDAVLMNPPFEHGQDCEHLRHAFDMVKKGGAVVCIMGAGLTFRQQNPHRETREWLEELGAEIVEIPAGAFKESGTGVASVMVTLNKD